MQQHEQQHTIQMATTTLQQSMKTQTNTNKQQLKLKLKTYNTNNGTRTTQMNYKQQKQITAKATLNTHAKRTTDT